MKILIAGGGIGGLTASLCLARYGHEVDVFEQEHYLVTDDLVYAATGRRGRGSDQVLQPGHPTLGRLITKRLVQPGTLGDICEHYRTIDVVLHPDWVLPNVSERLF